MSDWINITGYMVVCDDLPCRIGKKYNYNEENIESPEPSLCGVTTGEMLGKILISTRNNHSYFLDDEKKIFNPFDFWGRILWKIPKMNDDGVYEKDVEEEEWFKWDEIKLDEDTHLLEALMFPCGSEGPLDLTITPHIDRWGMSWHIVFCGNLRNRDSCYFKHVEKWWKALQLLLNIGSGFICASWLDEKWENII